MRRFRALGNPATAASPLHRATALACLAAFLAAVVGVPVVQPMVGVNGKDQSRPFPCMHGTCGCQNAEACWRGCCCLSDRQKLAWARANGVKAPDYVEAQAERETAGADAMPSGCCASSQGPTAECDAAAEDDAWRWQWVPAVAARKCRGLVPLWTILSVAAPLCQRAAFRPAEPLAGDVCLTAPKAFSVVPAPDTPPPRA